MAFSSKFGFIYLIRNRVNGKSYVGQTVKTIKKRFLEHLWSAKKGSGYAIHAAIRKHGDENFTIEMLAACDASQLNALEEYYIRTYGSSVNWGHGYNMTEGGGATSGWVPSEETRAKMSKAQKGRKQSAEHKEKVKATKALHPYKHSEEARAKISRATKGKAKPRELKAPVKEKRPLFGFTVSAETREKIRNAHLGKVLSEDHKKKLSESHKGKAQTAETVAKRAAANRGKHRSEETKEKMRAAALRRSIK